MLTVDQETEQFAEIYVDFQQLRVLTPELLGRLYDLLDKAEFLTFGPFETVVSDYLTARAEHSPPELECASFKRAFAHFARVQDFARAAGCAFRCAELFVAEARAAEAEEAISGQLRCALRFASRALATVRLAGGPARFGFSAEGLRFAKIQARLDEIERVRAVQNQREADFAVRRIAALEEEARALQLSAGNAGTYVSYTFERIRAFYTLIAARVSIIGAAGAAGAANAAGAALKMKPSAAVALSSAEVLEALAARGDFDECMNLVVNAAVSPSGLVQRLTKNAVDEIAAFYGETDFHAPQFAFLTSYLSKYEHKFEFAQLGVKIAPDVQKRLEMCLSALFDCLYYAKELKIGNSGFARGVQLSGDVYAEYVASVFVLSHRYAQKTKIVDCIRTLGPGPFEQGAFLHDGQLHTDLLQAGKLYDIEQEIRDYFIGQNREQMPPNAVQAQQIYKQQHGNVYKAPGGVKTTYSRPVTAGAGTFVQGRGVVEKQNEKLELDDLTVEKKPGKKVAFAI